MTWWRQPNGTNESNNQEGTYGVYFNRDEMKTRPRATPPALVEDRFLSPIDPKGGGSWISANKHGVIVALLNHWHLRASGTQSRGKIVWNLAQETCGADVEQKLHAMPVQDYSPFILIAMDSEHIRRWEWDGKELTESAVTNPSCSSSFEYENVRAAREQTFADLPSNSLQDLAVFHTEDSNGAYSVRMLRPDAQTWSRSLITINDQEVQWQYYEEFQDFKKVAKLWTSEMKLV